eukprot:Hpha_TRINITY_DN16287_c1_g1::TRINITY_DN16287_c1_g1_i1::g.11663::m.11663
MASRPAPVVASEWLVREALVGGSVAADSRGSSGIFGTLTQWLVTAIDQHISGGHVVAWGAAGAGAVLTQAVCIWLYTRWRDWYMCRSFLPGARYLFFGEQKLPILAEKRVHSQPDLPRERLLDMVTQVLRNGVSATLISGTVGCGKTWLLC